MTNNRTAGAAGQMQAGEPFAAAEPVAALLAAVATVADADALLSILRRRHDTAIAGLEQHAGPDPLAEDDELAAHAAERARRQREVDRTAAALERLAGRRAELAIAEAQSAARALIAGAGPAVSRAETLAADTIPKAAAKLAALFSDLRMAASAVLAARDAARLAGIADEAGDLVLPHEIRFRDEIAEDVVVTVRERAMGVYRADGSRTDGMPVEWVENRRTERRILQQRHRPASILAARVTLPTVDGGTTVLSEGEG